MIIGRLRGEVLERGPGVAVIEAGGVGYMLHVPERAGLMEGDRVDMFVHTQVGERSIALYGFTDTLEREVFLSLLKVQSVGPSKAMQILETPIDELIGLIGHNDVKGLTKLPNIGKKTAERMVLDLGERFASLVPPASASQPPRKAAPVRDDLISGLGNLGFKPADAEREADAAIAELGPTASFDQLFRLSLDHLRQR